MFDRGQHIGIKTRLGVITDFFPTKGVEVLNFNKLYQDCTIGNGASVVFSYDGNIYRSTI